jgi:hypothetical protein
MIQMMFRNKNAPGKAGKRNKLKIILPDKNHVADLS